MPVNAVQTSYVERQGVATRGMVVNERSWDAITRSAEVVVPFGVALCRGTDGKNQCALGGAIDLFLGVSMKDVTLEVGDGDTYRINSNVGVFVQGEIWARVSAAVTTNDPVHFDATTGVFAPSGGTGPVLGARWMEASLTDALDADILIARLYLPAYGQAT